MGCGKKEQADTASPMPATSSTPLTETKELPPPSQSPHEKSGDAPFLRYLRDDETYISPEQAKAMKKSDELGYVTAIASGQIITKRALLKRGIRAHERTQRARVRKAKRRNKTRKIPRGGRRKARHRPAKRRARTKRQRRKKRRTRRGGRRRRR